MFKSPKRNTSFPLLFRLDNCSFTFLQKRLQSLDGWRQMLLIIIFSCLSFDFYPAEIQDICGDFKVMHVF